MGWRGTLRTFAAAARAAERDSVRRQKARLKQQITDLSAQAVAEWEDRIHQLTSVHTDLAEAIDWRSIATKTRPADPVASRRHQDEAAARLAKFKPGIGDLFQGGSKRIHRKLLEALDHAPAKDRAEFENATAIHREAVANWEEEAGFARRVLGGDVTAIKEVLDEMKSLTGEGLVGSHLEFSFSKDFLHAAVNVHADDIVPNFRRKQLASGRLSESKMPVGEFNELYQDYVASVALRVAGDLLRALPYGEVIVTCRTQMLNANTGHQELTSILSVQIPRATFDKLNLEGIDPSDSMRNFNHSMKFSRTKGFAPISPLRSPNGSIRASEG